MTFAFTLEKLMQVKEQEAMNSRERYEKAVQQFETVGYELYRWLKEREEVNKKLEHHTTSGTTVANLQFAQRATERLEKNIQRSQEETNGARRYMVRMKSELQTANIELKKLEKMKGRKLELYVEEQKRDEQIQLDETATMQFLRNR